MLKHSRVSRAIDVNRLAQAVSRPGIDPRTWYSIAYAVDESVISKKGQFVDVLLSPSLTPVTCYVPADYAGNGFGSYRKVHKDDELLIGIPDGDSNNGGVVEERMWSEIDPPPAEAIANPDDIIDRIEDAKHYRLITAKGGKTYLKSDDKVIFDSPKVQLGGEDPSDAIIRGTAFRQAESTLDTAWQTTEETTGSALTLASAQMLLGTVLNAIPIIGGLLALPFFTLVATSGLAIAGSQRIALAPLIETFDTQAQATLSQVSSTK
jgi:hypothetical protein